MTSDTPALWRVDVGGRTRLARGPVDSGPVDLLAVHSFDALLGGPRDALPRALDEPGAGPVPPDARVVCPLDGQEVWAAGVTYRRSRDARVDESVDPGHYDGVYDAERPELFCKAPPGRSVGDGAAIAVRADSTWDVPEPELGVVADVRGAIVAYVLGNDVSSRSIEGANPLYLPQAKVYTASCAVGPCLVPADAVPAVADLTLRLEIARGGTTVVDGTVDLTELRRTPEELVDWLHRALEFPVGVVLLTGTGIVPPADFTLQAGDEVTVSGDGLGALRNPVVEVGR